MNKYYTPEIEEFHVGFEFEAKFCTARGVNPEDMEFSWETCTLGALDKFSSLIAHERIENYALEDGNIRVKYLDREDIESEGWEYKEHSSFNAQIHFIKNNKWLTVDFEDGTIMIHNALEYEDHFSWFSGKIKNKSELKKVLKMIGL